MAQTQFDTIYHEHFSYFSFLTAQKIFAAHGLSVFDVEELGTHGGSLRLYASHRAGGRHVESERVVQLAAREKTFGLDQLVAYSVFADKVKAAKRSLLRFLIDARESGQSVVGYGAPAKGNTLLNYCGVRADLLEYTVDRSPHKQGRYLPGTHIPVHSPDMILRTKPDYVLILPWNLQTEIVEQMQQVRGWGGRFVVPIPQARVLD
jgi:hypothetical protein